MIPTLAQKPGTQLNLFAAYCIFMIFFFVFSSSGYAIDLSAEEMAYLRAKETIVFVSQTQYPPFEYVDANYNPQKPLLDHYLWQVTAVIFGILLILLLVWIWNIRLGYPGCSAQAFAGYPGDPVQRL